MGHSPLVHRSTRINTLSATMPALKLSYFNFTGRAEISRIILAAGGKSYEDYRYKEGEWAATAQKECPFGQCPTLTVDGAVYGQSMAIARYLARECGFYGSSPLEQLAIDQWLDLASDFLSCAVEAIKEKDEAKKAEIWKKFSDEACPKFLAFFEKGLTGSKSGYFTDKLSVADMMLYEMVTGMLKDRMPALSGYPGIKKLVDQVGAVDKIKAYVAARDAKKASSI